MHPVAVGRSIGSRTTAISRTSGRPRRSGGGRRGSRGRTACSRRAPGGRGRGLEEREVAVGAPDPLLLRVLVARPAPGGRGASSQSQYFGSLGDGDEDVGVLGERRVQRGGAGLGRADHQEVGSGCTGHGGSRIESECCNNTKSLENATVVQCVRDLVVAASARRPLASDNGGMSAPVTVSVTRHIDPSRSSEMLAWVQAGTSLAEKLRRLPRPGWVRPVGGLGRVAHALPLRRRRRARRVGGLARSALVARGRAGPDRGDAGRAAYRHRGLVRRAGHRRVAVDAPGARRRRRGGSRWSSSSWCSSRSASRPTSSLGHTPLADWPLPLRVLLDGAGDDAADDLRRCCRGSPARWRGGCTADGPSAARRARLAVPRTSPPPRRSTARPTSTPARSATSTGSTVASTPAGC